MQALDASPLFRQMHTDEVRKCLECSGAKINNYPKDSFVFYMGERPTKLYILMEGVVAVGRDLVSGNRMLITTLDQPGELFGEVYLFLPSAQYDFYATAIQEAEVLEIPKEFFYHTCASSCGHHDKLIRNMLSVLAEKAQSLSSKLQLMSSTSLRQKIAKVLLANCSPDGTVNLKMSREEFADFIGAARPSLSRELMRMQNDNLIGVQGKCLRVLDLAELESLL